MEAIKKVEDAKKKKNLVDKGRTGRHGVHRETRETVYKNNYTCNFEMGNQVTRIRFRIAV